MANKKDEDVVQLLVRSAHDLANGAREHDGQRHSEHGGDEAAEPAIPAAVHRRRLPVVFDLRRDPVVDEPRAHDVGLHRRDAVRRLGLRPRVPHLLERTLNPVHRLLLDERAPQPGDGQEAAARRAHVLRRAQSFPEEAAGEPALPGATAGASTWARRAAASCPSPGCGARSSSSRRWTGFSVRSRRCGTRGPDRDGSRLSTVQPDIVRSWLVDDWISPQIEYHRQAAATHRRRDRWLGGLVTAMFAVTLAVVLARAVREIVGAATRS